MVSVWRLGLLRFDRRTSCRRSRALGALSVAAEFGLFELIGRTGLERSKHRRSSTVRAGAGLAWRLRSVTSRACLRTLHNAPDIICSPASGRRLPTAGPQIMGVMYKALRASTPARTRRASPPPPRQPGADPPAPLGGRKVRGAAQAQRRSCGPAGALPGLSRRLRGHCP